MYMPSTLLPTGVTKYRRDKQEDKHRGNKQGKVIKSITSANDEKQSENCIDTGEVIQMSKLVTSLDFFSPV